MFREPRITLAETFQYWTLKLLMLMDDSRRGRMSFLEVAWLKERLRDWRKGCMTEGEVAWVLCFCVLSIVKQKEMLSLFSIFWLFVYSVKSLLWETEKKKRPLELAQFVPRKNFSQTRPHILWVDSEDLKEKKSMLFNKKSNLWYFQN